MLPISNTIRIPRRQRQSLLAFRRIERAFRYQAVQLIRIAVSLPTIWVYLIERKNDKFVLVLRSWGNDIFVIVFLEEVVDFSPQIDGPGHGFRHPACFEIGFDTGQWS